MMVGVRRVGEEVFSVGDAQPLWAVEDEADSSLCPTGDIDECHSELGFDQSESPGISSNLQRPSSWSPVAVAFRPFAEMGEARSVSAESLDGVKRETTLTKRMTVNLTETYQSCNPNFSFSETSIPKCVVALTKPSEAAGNDGFDNVNCDLILCVNGVLDHAEAGTRYRIKDSLGQGTFGQVVKCENEKTGEQLAVKVIKNQPAYHHQAMVEISIVRMLNRSFDSDDSRHIVRLVDHFVFRNHLCIVFELLTFNLFELIKQNQFRGLSLNLVRLFTKQLLTSLATLEEAKVIHCDLKPENILLKGLNGQIKLIDFGSACMANRTVYSYIQSRFYRSPEVLLGHPYTTAIDMWSLGCVSAELFLGLPLFPGASEFDLLQRMVETLGCQPPDHILRNSKHSSRFFKRTAATSAFGSGEMPSAAGGGASASSSSSARSIYHLQTIEEFSIRENSRPSIGKRYFSYTLLEDIIMNYNGKRGAGGGGRGGGGGEEEFSEASSGLSPQEREEREIFCDFLRGLMELDPSARWTPRQAAQHPFITEEAFIGPFRPEAEPNQVAVGHGLNLAHDPLAGHWSTTGLSPQVHSSHLPQAYAGYSQRQSLPGFSYGSYGSIGSYGSFHDPSSLHAAYHPYHSMQPSQASGQNPDALSANPDCGRYLLPTLSNASQLGTSSYGPGMLSSSHQGMPGAGLSGMAANSMLQAYHQSQQPVSHFQQRLGLHQISPGSSLSNQASFLNPLPPGQAFAAAEFDPSSPSVHGGSLADFAQQQHQQYLLQGYDAHLLWPSALSTLPNGNYGMPLALPSAAAAAAAAAAVATVAAAGGSWIGQPSPYLLQQGQFGRQSAAAAAFSPGTSPLFPPNSSLHGHHPPGLASSFASSAGSRGLEKAALMGQYSRRVNEKQQQHQHQQAEVLQAAAARWHSSHSRTNSAGGAVDVHLPSGQQAGRWDDHQESGKDEEDQKSGQGLIAQSFSSMRAAGSLDFRHVDGTGPATYGFAAGRDIAASDLAAANAAAAAAGAGRLVPSLYGQYREQTGEVRSDSESSMSGRQGRAEPSYDSLEGGETGDGGHSNRSARSASTDRDGAGVDEVAMMSMGQEDEASPANWDPYYSDELLLDGDAIGSSSSHMGERGSTRQRHAESFSDASRGGVMQARLLGHSLDHHGRPAPWPAHQQQQQQHQQQLPVSSGMGSLGHRVQLQGHGMAASFASHLGPRVGSYHGGSGGGSGSGGLVSGPVGHWGGLPLQHSAQGFNMNAQISSHGHAPRQEHRVLSSATTGGMPGQDAGGLNPLGQRVWKVEHQSSGSHVDVTL